MFTLNLEDMLAIAGILLGVTFGIIGGISREEKVKYISISVFRSILVAFAGISFIAYGYSLEILLGFMIWSCLGFISTFIIGLTYRRKRDKPFFGVLPNLWGPGSLEIDQIKRNAPEVEPRLRIIGNFILGFKIEISVKIKNSSPDILDKLYVSLKISDLHLKKKEKTKFKDLPNIVQNETREFTISERMSRFGKYAIDLEIIRNRVLLEEFHWTMK